MMTAKNVKRGDLWIVSLEPKKGSEVGKQRPALVVQTDFLNQVNHPTCLIAPISSQAQSENLLRYKISNSSFHNKLAYVLIDQIRSIDVQLRFRTQIGSVSEADLLAISTLIKHVFDLNDTHL